MNNLIKTGLLALALITVPVANAYSDSHHKKHYKVTKPVPKPVVNPKPVVPKPVPKPPITVITLPKPTPIPAPTPTPVPPPTPAPTPVDGKIPAFPGAEGYGAETIGGRGGQVIEVTNLSDEGPGSFRAAVEASGPRIVVFRVGGTINTTGIRIVNPYLTVAGQTAPGGGIALKQVAGGIPEFFVLEGTHDVIIRGIRSRPGPVSENHGIAILDSRRIIVDHCSFSWAVDENIDFWYATEYVTIQNSIVSEGLMNSIHEKGGHSMAILIGSDAPDDSAGNISLHHNLIAHNNARHPLSEGNPNLQIINNLVYNYGAESAALEPGGGGSTIVDFIGNYYKSGPDSESGYAIVEAATNSEIYVKGNISASRSSLTDPEWDFVDASSGFQSSKAFCTGLPFPVTTTAYPNFVNPLLNSVGAFPRDSVDTRVVNDVKNGTGRIIDDPSQVGGWPTLAAGTAPTDTDHDGIPDSWETSHGLNLNNEADGNLDRDGDGYTNVEEYINTLLF